MDIKFSVLMSVYYKEKPCNLKLSMESILNQTMVPNQIVLVEDGPLSKELNNLIDEYEKNIKFLDVIKLKKNNGLGNALNIGLDYCKYEFVARMDSDDISIDDRFENQAKFIQDNPSVDAVGGNIIEFDDNTENDISLRKVPLNTENIKEYLKRRNPMNHVTVMFKKKSVINSGGYLDCPYFEDYFLWARMINNGCKLSNINKTLVRVRAGLSMANRRGNLRYIKSIISFERKLKKLKIINISEFISNIIIRTLVAIIPNKMRYGFYQRNLRNMK